MQCQAVLLDRDGVINVDSPDYILSPAQWIPVPGSLQAIARLTQANIPVAICSNQSAVARGMLSMDDFERIHGKMMCSIEAAGGRVSHVSYCFHGPADGCVCRKPLPDLLHEALQGMGVQASADVYMIGDSVRDIEAAHAANVSAILVRTGYGDADAIWHQSQTWMPDILSVKDLSAAVDHILGEPC